MSYINIRNVKIGEGIPKICVPIVGETREDILKSAKRVETSGADLVEWRVDWYESVFCVSKVESIAGELREILKDIPLLFTFRTAREGGKKAIDLKHYVELNERIIKAKAVDLIDIELFAGVSVVKKIIESAHKENVKVVVSNHDFEKTPTKEEIVWRHSEDSGNACLQKRCTYFIICNRRNVYRICRPSVYYNVYGRKWDD